MARNNSTCACRNGMRTYQSNEDSLHDPKNKKVLMKCDFPSF